MLPVQSIKKRLIFALIEKEAKFNKILFSCFGSRETGDLPAGKGHPRGQRSELQ